MSHSVRLKTRNISRLSGYCKFRYRLRSCLGSRFRSIFRNCPVLEMLAVQFSNFEILSISFERIHGKNTLAYLGVFNSQNCLRLFFLLDSHGSYCVHLKKIELSDILQSLTTNCLAAIWRIVLLQQIDTMQIRKMA